MVSKILDVYMNGYKVGEFTRATNGAHEFRYVSEWLNLPGNRPISMSLPLRIQAYKGVEVFNFFDNLLPDNQKIRERIQARYKSLSLQPFDLLESIGKDCVGAIQIVPHGQEIYDIQKIEYEELSEIRLGEILTSYKTDVPLGMIAEDFRISIAGAQEKTALLKYNDQWCLPKKFTPTTHIFKLPIGFVNEQIDMSTSIENEYICLLIAREYGLSVPDFEIIELDGIKSLIVKRFDRQFSTDKRWIMRLPQEDYCQVLKVPPGKKYESDGGPGIKEIMENLLGSDNAEVDRENFMKAQVLFWLLAAPDGHAKNFSLFIKPNGRYNLTPFYDILSAYPVVGKQGLFFGKIKLAMSLKGTSKKRYKISRVYPRHFIATANYVGFDPDKMIDILKEFKEMTPKVIAAVRKKLPKNFDENVKNSILNGLLDCAAKLEDVVEKKMIEEKAAELNINLEKLYLDINLMQKLVRSVYECLIELDVQNTNEHITILHQKSPDLVDEIDLLCNFHLPEFSEEFEKWYKLLELFFEAKNPVIIQLVQYQRLSEEFKEIYRNKLYPAFKAFDEKSQNIKQEIINAKKK